jgi:glutathione S-transferase
VGAKLALPDGIVRRVAPGAQRLLARIASPDREAARAALDEVPAILDHVDALIEEGVIGRTSPNTAALHAAVLVRMLMCFDDLRPTIQARPAKALARRLCPHTRFPGRVPPVLESLAPAGVFRRPARAAAGSGS